MSRSASVVIGYLMSKNKTSLKETIEHVRKNRFVRYNRIMNFFFYHFYN